MSSKSNSTNQVISLPKGGGALHGVGEKFSPDLHTGTGNYTVPLELPPGRNGFQPQLSLVYSTGNGNGPFGLGWGLSLPGISRKTSQGIPRYEDSTDVFVLSGTEDLVRVGEDIGAVTYRPRTEGLFAHIQRHHDAHNDYWEVKSKDGLVSLYGTPRPEAAGPAWRDPAVIADPDNPQHIFSWKLTHTLDPFGNRIDYIYERDAEPTQGNHHWDQIYLSEIHYADYGDPADPQFLVAVEFTYEDRTDCFSEYRSGFEIRTVRRCNQIAISTRADAEALVRTYHFIYLDQRSDPVADHLPLNGVSLLSQIKVVGHDDARGEELPPLEFGYTRFEPERRDFFPLTGSNLPAASLARPDYELVDLFGNGLPDILEMNGAVRYWRNLGDGRFDLPREMRAAPAGLSLADTGVQLIDANGDGRPDLLVATESHAGYYPLRFGGLWDRRSFQRYRAAPSFDLKDPEVRLIDLTGDGITDAIRSGSRMECFYNDPREGWKASRRVERRPDLDVFPDINFSDSRVRWADMSGDGLQDVVLLYDGNVEYWPNLGYGNWGKRIHMRNSPRFPYGYEPKRILIGDVDGDGLADIVYVDDTTVTLWINQCGNRWSDPIEIDGTPPISDMDAVRLADMLGSGVSGVLWSTDAGDLSRETMFFLDFTGDIKPYLLNEMDNHTGAETRVEYASSTRFYLEDAKRPETRWKTPLPFPVQVVARVEVIDSISGGKLITEYNYHHGYWDGAEREFRGFGRVDQRDTQTFEDYHSAGPHAHDHRFEPVTRAIFSPPTETRTWFHQGPIGDEFGEWEEADFTREYWTGDLPAFTRPPETEALLRRLNRRARRDALRALRGHILRKELYALDGTERQSRPYTVTEQLYDLREEMSPGPGESSRRRIFFSHPLAQRTTQWERGDDPMSQLVYTDDYDEFGQPRSQISIGVPRGRDFRAASAGSREPYLVTCTITDYARPEDERDRIMDRISRTTTYEIINDGSPSVFDLRMSILSGSASRRLIGQTLNFYDGPAFQGLPFGRVGRHGALVRTESLVLTEQILRDAYRSGDDVQTPPEEPPYMGHSGSPSWTAEYPQDFRALLPASRVADPTRPGLAITPAGYGFASGESGSPHAGGYFAASERRRYDFQDSSGGEGRGLLKAARDVLGRDTSITYDPYSLLPIEVADPAGLTIRADYDYRVLQPREVTDANGNRMAYTFTPLGLLESISIRGKHDEPVGDTPAAPGTRMVYDLLAFADPRRRQPISVRTIRRVHHATDTDVPLSDRHQTIETVEYSDGFGRLLQTRTQAGDLNFGDPAFGDQVLSADQSIIPGDAVGRRRAGADAPRVVVSGWQVYDNKGEVVEKYEPFFSSGWEFSRPTDAQRGQKATLYYDPRGQVIRTVNPDGSEQRVVYGMPELANPESFEPTPWEVYTYDANDNAGRTHSATATGYRRHWNTPTSTLVDSLGRTVETVERNGPDQAADWYITRSTYDIRGNLLTVTDALGRVAFHHVYDLANRPLRIESIDAGLRRIVLDAAGNEVERRDGKGALILHSYDVLNRAIRLWARDATGQPLTLRERLIYGDSADSGLSLAQARTANLSGKLYKHYDEAGLLSVEAYDFKGNVLEKTRQVIGDAPILAVFNPPPPGWQVQTFRVNWQPPEGTTLRDHAAGLLDANMYRTSVAYDALNRAKTIRYPESVDGGRKALRPHYNRAGALERVELDGATYVDHIAYNAKGQRTLIAYGNGVMTRYAYDPQTFRLTRLRTERYARPAGAAVTFRPTAPADPLQDYAYEYDLAGNILKLHDRTPGSGLPSRPDSLDRDFSYDPLNRLLSATGRECDAATPLPPWRDEPRCADLTRTRAYTERYQYDSVGNLMRLQHQADSGFTREFTLAAGNNRLAAMTVGATVYDYAYDHNGNLTRETSSRHFEWDHSDRMKAYRTQAGDAEPSVHAHYFYDATGQRVKKLVRKQGGQVEVTVYIDGAFEHTSIVEGRVAQSNNTLHVMDDQKRIAIMRIGSPFRDDHTPAVKFHLGDHLGSSNVVIDAEGGWTNREEHTPYGETSFGSFAKKRYRFNGKERDEESGLNYHGARYYSPWMGRWIGCDPESVVDGINLFVYSRNNPARYQDPTGRNTIPTDADLDSIRRELDQLEQPLAGFRQQAQQLQQEAEDAATEGQRILSLQNVRRTAIENLISPVETGARTTSNTARQIENEAQVVRAANLLQQLRDYSTALQQQISAGVRTSGTNVTRLMNRVTTLLSHQTTQAIESIQSNLSRANRDLQRFFAALLAWRGGSGGGGGRGSSSNQGNNNSTRPNPWTTPAFPCITPRTVGRPTSPPWWAIAGTVATAVGIAVRAIGSAVVNTAARATVPLFMIRIDPNVMYGRGSDGSSPSPGGS